MKKLIIISLLLVNHLSFSATEITNVQYKYGEIELKIPSDYKKLKEQFIALAIVHAEEIKDYSSSLKNYKQALEINKKLATINFSLIERLKDIVDRKLLDRAQAKHFIYFNTGMTFSDKFGYYGGLGYKVILLNKWMLGVDVFAPIAFGISIGFKL